MLPIFSVTSPAVPVHTFFSSIVPVFLVLVNVQITWSPDATATLLFVPTETAASESLVPLLFASLKHASAGV